MNQAELDASIAEYNLSMAHGDLSSILEDADTLNTVLNRIYKTWPETYYQIEAATRMLTSIILRANRARRFADQELKRLPAPSMPT